MGYIAALLSKTGGEVSSTLTGMLGIASPSQGETYGIACDGGLLVKGSPTGLGSLGSGTGLGHKLIKIASNDQSQPVLQYGYAMALEGRIWRSAEMDILSKTADIIGIDPRKGIRELITECEGSYVVAAIDRERLIFGRDAVGVVPLYYGENEYLIGVASNRKMLWSAGLNAVTVPTGHVGTATRHGVIFEAAREMPQPQTKAISMKDAVEELDKLLANASDTRCIGFFRVALGLSGGIDSSLLAHYLDASGCNVYPICVGLEGSEDFRAAEEAAESLGLPLRIESHTHEEVDEDLDDVLWSVEEPDTMKVGVAIPLYWSARSAAESGCKVFFSGTGSDEVFGGYRKYITEYYESGEAVRLSMYRDVAGSHEVNFERDYKICSDLGLELRLPFADDRVVDFGLSLPTGLKLLRVPESPRKLVLRALAEKLGFPKQMAHSRKRAAQYSTGAHKALKALAKKRGKTLAGYISERFEKVRGDRLGGR
jgi:asparagine synthase (glutamine-hydrolysing)